MTQVDYWWGRAVTLFTGEGETGERVARGSAVLFLGRFLLKGVYFIRTIVLAHLLFPSDFGLFGLAALSLGFTSIFFTSGLNTALVHSREDPKRYLDAMWTVGVIRNTLLALLICATAPLAALFFKNQSIIPMIYLLSLSTFFVGFENIGIVLLEKELRLNRKFLFDLSVVTLEVISVIVAAFVLRNAWALVVGAVANRFLGTIVSYWFHPYRPRLTLHLEGAWELFGYGKWVALAGILAFLIGQGDNIVVGRLLSTEQLGFYQLAFTLAFIPALEFSRVLGNVLFPMFAKLQNDADTLKRSFIKASRLIFAVVTPMSFGLLVIVPEFVHVFYGARWAPMVPLVNILMVYGLLRSFEFIAKPLLMGIGRPRMTFFTQIAQFAGMFLFIVPLTQSYGAAGTAWSVVIGGITSITILLVVIHRHFGFTFRTYFDMIGVSSVASLSMYAVLALGKLVLPIASTFSLFVYIALGILLYAAFLFVLDLFSGREIMTSFLWVKNRL